MKPTISLCMIVKNEEDIIASCLEHAKPYVTEIIVVDTGSTDNTRGICEQHGARVITHEWKDDFADARNVALSHATSEWILVLDADELISETDFSFLSSSHKDVFWITICNIKSTSTSSHQALRLFRNKKGYGYMYRIHEQLMKNRKPVNERTIGTSPVVVEHRGYEEEIVQRKNKHERNLQLLLKELAERPHDRKVHLHLANQYVMGEKYKQAVHHYNKATKKGTDKLLLKHAVMKMVLALKELNQTDEALKVLEQAISYYPAYSDLYFARGVLLEGIGHDEGAILSFRRCIEQGETSTDFYTQQGIATYGSLTRLASIYRRHADFDNEVKILEQLFLLNPLVYATACRFFELQRLLVGYQASLQMIDFFPSLPNKMKEKVRLHLESKEQRFKTTFLEQEPNSLNIFYLCDLSKESFETWLHSPSPTFEQLLTLAEVHYQMGWHQETISLSNKLLERNPAHFRSINLLLKSAVAIGEKELAHELARDMLKTIPNDLFFSSF